MSFVRLHHHLLWMNDILPTLIVKSSHVIKDWISMTVADNVGHMFGLYIPHPYMCVSTGSSETHAGGGMSGSVFIETPLSKTHYHQHYYYVRQSHLPSPWSQTFISPRHPPRTYCTFWIWILPLFCQWLYVIVNSLIIQLTYTKYTRESSNRKSLIYSSLTLYLLRIIKILIWSQWDLPQWRVFPI